MGKPMVERVVDSVQISDIPWIEPEYVFIVQAEHREKYDLDTILERIRPGCTIVPTRGGVTEGAAASVLLAEGLIDNDRPLFVINSDNIIDWDFSYKFWMDDGADGVIATFYAAEGETKWSFITLDEFGFVTEVAEKKRISSIATAGVYGWRRGSNFVKAAKEMIAANDRVNGEFYLAPVYNWCIRAGACISYFHVTEMNGVGTPEDLLDYEKRMAARV